MFSPCSALARVRGGGGGVNMYWGSTEYREYWGKLTREG